MDIQINEKLVKYNFSSRNGEKIKYIVIHTTDNTSKGANANAHYLFFNSGDQQASAHYFVDDTQILRIIKDSDKAWHCGDGHGKYGITNENSIGVEMCVNEDGNFEKTEQNTLKLTKYLVEKYNISFENVVRHYDASRKICPSTMSKNNWDMWDKFKSELKKLLTNTKDYTKVLTLLYNNVFQRDPDSEGLNYWNDKLNSGLTFGDFLKTMGESEEFKGKYFV